ncbi:MAG: M56 family metallopeptidase [Cyanobacteria bacterium P01_A01_bin.17]
MHVLLILSALALAYGLRLNCPLAATDTHQWQQTLVRFLVPPLLLLMTAISILLMGPQGQMIWGHTGWTSTLLAASFLVILLIAGLRYTHRAWQTLHQLNHYPCIKLHNQTGRYLNTSTPFIARMGFWKSELVFSQGLLDTFTPEQIAAILVHEQAHEYYRDTFWFFWLGWIHQWTRWLPEAEAIWQELLILRELRADRWAAQRVDGLLLAESLMLMVQSPLWSDALCASFSPAAPQSRIEERIDALLAAPQETASSNARSWSWILLALLPLLTVPFHH